MCAGGARIFTCAWVAINVLRRVLGCSLPVQVWHIGPAELGSVEVALLRPLGVEVVDALACTKRWPARKLGGWELKAYALVHSRFEQALLLDADNVAVIDPGFLFDLPQFADTGAIAWPDVERLTPASRLWELCGIPYRSEPAWESGQLVVDKRRCWHALQIALHMNMHSEVFYPHTMGDKETFHLAWILAARKWAMPGHPARWTPTGIYQRDFEGRLVFQHRSQAKWRLTGPNQLAANFHHQDECLRFLEELRDRWRGRINVLPPPSLADEAVEAALAEHQWMKLEEPGTEDILLELLSQNRVGIGAVREDRLRWYVRDDLLTIDGALEALPVLRRSERDGLVFAAEPPARALVVRPAPQPGPDALGVTALSVLERFQAEGTISEDEAVITLATLAKVGDLRDALTRARAGFRDSEATVRVIDRALRRKGLDAPSEKVRERPGHEWID